MNRDTHDKEHDRTARDFIERFYDEAFHRERKGSVVTRVGEPGYAIKFMATIDEEQAREAAGLLRQSIVPDLKEWGFCQVLILSRRVRMTESRVLQELLEEASPESRYAQHMRDLHETLAMGGPKSQIHSMLHRRNKERYPEEHRTMKAALEGSDNWVEVPVRKFDCFAIYDTVVDMKADTLGRRNLPDGRPHSGDLVAGELEHLLASPLRGTHHRIVYRSLDSLENAFSAYTAQTQVAMFLHLHESRDWVHEKLLPSMSGQEECLGTLVLRSRQMGFVAGKGTVPRSLGEHRGNSAGLDRKPARIPSVPCECVTLWRTEDSAEKGAALVADSLPWMVSGNLASDFIRNTVHTESGEVELAV